MRPARIPASTSSRCAYVAGALGLVCWIRFSRDPGDIITFGEVLVVGGETPTLGAPTVAGASVAAEVLEQGRGPKVIAFKKRRRKNSRRKRGHRQEFTLVRISEILTDGAKPSKTAAPKRAKKPKTDEKAASEGAAAPA